MTHLITEEEIKTLTDIGDNVDVGKFSHFIPIAQQKQIRNAIGTQCFTDILTQVKNNTLTTVNRTLLDGNDAEYEGLKPALAWWVLFYAYPSLHSNVVNTGVSTSEGDNFSSVSNSVLTTRINQAKVQAEYYLDQAICFLSENETDYPCYAANDNCCDSLIKEGYGTSGIVLNNPLKNRVEGECPTCRSSRCCCT